MATRVVFPGYVCLETHGGQDPSEREGAVLPSSFQLRLGVNDDIGDVWQLLA
jgi:hypothetical protein